MNLSQLRSEVANRLGLDNSTSGDQGSIDSWLNEGMTDVILKTACNIHPATFTLTSGTNDYTMSTSVMAILDAYVTSSSVDYPMQKVSVEELLEYRRNTVQVSPPTYYALAGSNLFMVYPTPDSADTVHIYYVPRPTTLSATGDSPSDIPSEWHRLVYLYALWQGADYDDDGSSQQGERYRALYEQGLREFNRYQARKGRRRPAPATLRQNRLYVPHDRSQYPQ